MMEPGERWLTQIVALAASAWLSLWAADAAAFDSYTNYGAAFTDQVDCSLCHPGFIGGFGAPLHDQHLTLTSDCSDCHVIPGDNPSIGLNVTGTTGCVGCHGRTEDDVGQLGALGAGLRLRHKNAGVSFSCEDCHDADPVPVGENVLPPFYASLGLSPCSDGLDNDGDLDVDGDDPDCPGNLAPVPDPGGPYSGNTDVALTLDGSASFDIDGAIVSYDWDFGDGSFGTGVFPTHTYTGAGLYTVLLTVTDDGGTTNTANTTADISDLVNLPPSADSGGPYSGVVGQPILFDASNTVDPDGDSLIYLWDFGDGSSPPLPSHDPMASHTYDTVGEYTAQLAVTDGINDPVLVDVPVSVAGAPPPPEGDVWTMISPYTFDQITLSLEPFAGILMVQITESSGASSKAIGMEMDGVIFWMDITGAIYFGNIDRTPGTMSGVAFGGPGGGGVWFAQQI